MKKVLYISNHRVPYRTKFFNLLAESCELTVAYQSRDIQARNKAWTESETAQHRECFLQDAEKGNVMLQFFALLKLVFFVKWDVIIFGCWNEKPQLFTTLVLRLLQKKYVLNLDGNYFFEGDGLKARLKQFLLKGAHRYVVAGEQHAKHLHKYVGENKIVAYHFSSLCREEVVANVANSSSREDFVLVVGQYCDCKGLDVALGVAAKNQAIPYKFVGLGTRKELFVKDFSCHIPPNVELISFLPKESLFDLYRRCKAFLLPSRKECWGLVINEAASFGTPIVSTYGSGAAEEFLAEHYSQYLAQPNNVDSLYNCLEKCLSEDDSAYSNYLKNISKRYTIEESVREHVEGLHLN